MGFDPNMEILTAVSSDITFYDLHFDEIKFKHENNVVVLIESSQTIKIVIEELDFDTHFKFKSNSPVFTDEGDGFVNNTMTLTLAIQPSYWSVTGKVLLKFNSIVVQIFNFEENNFMLKANTIPLQLSAEQFRNWRKLILTRINDMLKIFKDDIEDSVNIYFANKFYEETNDTNSSWNISDPILRIKCPLAIPFRDIRDLSLTEDVCMCQNLVDYQKEILNPSIRDDFISLRFYAMTFSPNREETLANLIPSSELKYMPTYEVTNDENLVQMFISENYINSIIVSFAIDGILNRTIVEDKTDVTEGINWYRLAGVFFKSTAMAKGCLYNLRLHSMEKIDITAGQLHQKNTTLALEFYKPSEKEGEEKVFLARVYICIEMWMSFKIETGYKLRDIYVGEKNTNYKISARLLEESNLGKLVADDTIMKYFATILKILEKDDFYFDIYEHILSEKNILKNLVPTFEDIHVKLVDRYLSVDLQPNYNSFLAALKNIGCPPQENDKILSVLWKIICTEPENPLKKWMGTDNDFLRKERNQKATQKVIKTPI